MKMEKNVKFVLILMAIILISSGPLSAKKSRVVTCGLPRFLSTSPTKPLKSPAMISTSDRAL